MYDYSFSAIRLGFSDEVYSGNEGPDQRSTLQNAPCRVFVRLHDITLETNLTLRIIPQTIPEYDDANGSLPTPTPTGANASSKYYVTVSVLCS